MSDVTRFTTPMVDIRPDCGLTIGQLLHILREQVASITFVGSLPMSTASTDAPPARTNLLI